MEKQKIEIGDRVVYRDGDKEYFGWVRRINGDTAIVYFDVFPLGDPRRAQEYSAPLSTIEVFEKKPKDNFDID